VATRGTPALETVADLICGGFQNRGITLVISDYAIERFNSSGSLTGTLNSFISKLRVYFNVLPLTSALL
jgi:hypothetical protein